MKNRLLLLSSHIDRLINTIGNGTSWLTLVLIFLMCTDVLLRYLFSNTKNWIIELEWHIFSVLFLLGLSYTLLHDRHVRVDLFYEKLSVRKRNIINAIGLLVFALPWCYLVLITSFDYAANSFSYRESSAQPGGLPAVYVIKSFIFIGFFLLVLQAISLLIKAILRPDYDATKYSPSFND